MPYEMTAEERRIWWRELEMTEYYFLQNELKNRAFTVPADYRKYLENRVAELREKFEG